MSFLARQSSGRQILKSQSKSRIFTYMYSHCLQITQNVAFEFWHFPPIFVLLKLTCLVTLFDRKLQFFKNSPNWPFLALMNFCPKCKRSSLRSQSWMRLLLWFSYTVMLCSTLAMVLLAKLHYQVRLLGMTIGAPKWLRCPSELGPYPLKYPKLIWPVNLPTFRILFKKKNEI